LQTWINPIRAKFPSAVDVVVLTTVPIVRLSHAFNKSSVARVHIANDKVQVSRVTYFDTVSFHIDLLVVCKKILRTVSAVFNNGFHGYPSNRIEVDDKARPAGTDDTVVESVPSPWT